MPKENAHFHFKRFSVDHTRCAMKVGTDGVLLGCWTDVTGASNILDIGTGCGVIALMLAQRTPDNVLIDAVEIREEDAQQARENVERSPWPQKVRVYNTSVQEFQAEKKYDLIVTNPPFFVNSFPPPDLGRMGARHTATLSFSDLLDAAVRLLSDQGTLSVILPSVEGALFREHARTYGLFCNRLCQFRPRANKPVERWLMSFTRHPIHEERSQITMYGDGNTWSEEFKALSWEFYLKL